MEASFGGFGIYVSRVLEAYRAGDAWVYFCAFYPIFHDARENLEQMSFPAPIMLVLQEIAIEQWGIMRGKNVADGTPVVLFQADHPEPRAVFEQFQAELTLVEPAILAMYESSLARDVERERARWRCVYWGKD